jgi:predicted DNA-binding transcriptional regulator YafY
MKSDRLLSMLLLLQAKGRLCARELATSLEVSERTVYRDLDSLSAAGIPVHAERGSGGGIVLADGYRRALTQFRDDELRALFVSGADALADLGLDGGRAKALEKIAGALSATQRKAVENIRRRIHIDPRRWKQAAQPRDILATLRQATSEDDRVLLHYRDRDGRLSERIIDPLGLVAKAGIWYVVARAGTDMRVFRAERIVGATIANERFERPASFDLLAFWERWSSEYEKSLPGYPIVVAVAPYAFEDVTAYWEWELLQGTSFASRARRARDATRNWRIVRLLFPSLDVALAHVVMWGERVNIMEPAELRDAVLQRAESLVARYKTAAASRRG